MFRQGFRTTRQSSTKRTAGRGGRPLARWGSVFLVALMLAAGTLGSVPQAQATSFLERAQEYLDEGDLGSAEIELKNALQRDPNNAEARFLLGKVQLRLGQPEAAEKELTAARDLGYQNEELDLMLAYARLAQDRFDEVAGSIPDEAEAANDMQRDLFVARGEALMGLGKFDEAREAFDKVLAGGPHVRALTLRARLALQLGDPESARKDLDRALAMNKEDALLSFVDGQWLYQERRFDEAIPRFKHAIELGPTQLQPRLALVQAYIMENDLTEAGKVVDAMLRIAPNNLIVILHRAIIQFLEGKFEDAKTNADRVLARVPDQSQAMVVSGFSAYHLGQFEQARRHLEAHVNSNPQDQMSRMILGATLLRLGQAEKAYEIVGSPDIEVPDHGAYLSVLLESALASGNRAAALDYLERLAEKSPEDAGLQGRLGTVRLQGGDFDGAVSAFNKAIELAPDEIRNYERLFYAHLRQEADGAALEVAKTVESRFPDKGTGDLLRGIVLVNQEKLPEAQAAFESALEKDPDDLAAANNISSILLLQGETDQARAFMDKALEKHPDNVRMLTKYASLEMDHENYDAAESLLTRALTARPDNTTVLLRLARLNELRGQPDAAANRYREVLQQRDLPDAYLGLTRISLGTGKYAEAEDQAEELLRRDPNNVGGLFLLAEAQRGLGQSARAVKTLEQVAALAPESADAQFWLARSYLDINEVPKATAALEKALTLDPEHVEARVTYFRLAIRTKQTDKALQLADTAPDSVAQNAEILNMGGQVALARGDIAGALSKFRSAWGRLEQPQGPTAREIAIGLAQTSWASDEHSEAVGVLEKWFAANPNDAQVALLLASRQREAGQPEAAEQTYRKIIEEAPDNWQARNDLAMLLYDKRDLESALSMAQSAQELAGEDAYVLDTLGIILLASGKQQDALATLRKSSSLEPRNLEISFHLAQALAENDKQEEALTVLDRILSQPDQFPGRESAENLYKRLTN